MRENQLPVHYTSAEETGRARAAVDSGDAHDSKLGIWPLAAAVISVTTLFTALYSICNPESLPSFVAQTVKISKQLLRTPRGGTAVTDTAKAEAGTVANAAGIHGEPTGQNSESVVQPKGETGDHDPKPMANNPEASEAKTSKSKKEFMVPPPPPTPCVLPPAFGSFPTQPAQQDEVSQQPKTGAAAGENAPHEPTAAEASQSAALDAADQELQAAMNSSLRTVGEWTR